MATLSYILGQVQTALTTSQGTLPALFGVNSCFYGFDPLASLDYPPADKYCCIQPQSADVKDRSWAGTNSITYIMRMEFTVWLFVRFGTDEAHRDDDFLLDQTYGSIVTTDDIIDRLQDYVMTDGANVFGFQLKSVEFQTEDRDAKGWGQIKLSYYTDVSARSTSI